MGLLINDGRCACGIAVSGGCSQARSGPILLYTQLDYNCEMALHVDRCV